MHKMWYFLTKLDVEGAHDGDSDNGAVTIHSASS